MSVFLSKTGLSMSDANHVANLAKERARLFESFLFALSGKIRKIGDQIIEAPPEFTTQEVSEAIDSVANLYRVSAWFREGIKAKNEMIDSLMNESYKKLPFNEPQPQPEMTNYCCPTEQEVLESWSIKDRFEYLSLEASAAHIGKQIHDGPVSKLRQQMLDRTTVVPTETINEGKITTVYVTQENSVPPEEVEELFFDLQKKHREVESRLNYFKARLKNELAKLTLERQAEYRKKNAAAQAEYEKELSAWQSRFNSWTTKEQEAASNFESDRQARLSELSSLKVTIPNELASLVERLKNN